VIDVFLENGITLVFDYQWTELSLAVREALRHCLFKLVGLARATSYIQVAVVYFDERTWHLRDLVAIEDVERPSGKWFGLLPILDS